MPKQNSANPPCPHCGGITRKNGKCAHGQRYRCDRCEKSFSDSPYPIGSLPSDLPPPNEAAAANRKSRAKRAAKRQAIKKPVD